MFKRKNKTLDDLTMIEARVEDMIDTEYNTPNQKQYTLVSLDHDTVKECRIRRAPEISIGDMVRIFFDCGRYHTASHTSCNVAIVEILDDYGEVSRRRSTDLEYTDLYLASVGWKPGSPSSR